MLQERQVQDQYGTWIERVETRDDGTEFVRSRELLEASPEYQLKLDDLASKNAQERGNETNRVNMAQQALVKLESGTATLAEMRQYLAALIRFVRANERRR
jgi:hypothetical protein